MSSLKSYIHIIKVVFLYQVLFFSTFFNPLHAEIKKYSNIYSELSIVNSDEKENTILSEYLLGPGDSIFIEFIGLDIFTNNYQIGREGKIFLPEIKGFLAGGFTVRELEKKLKEVYKEFLINPEFNIFLTAPRPVSVFIHGEVKNPGLYTLNNDVLQNPSFQINKIESKNIPTSPSSKIPSIISPKLFDAIKIARGFTNNADLSNIQIIRKNSISQGGGEIISTLNFLNLITKGDQTTNIILHDGDSIYVPESKEFIYDQVLAINKTNINPSEILVYITGNVRSGGRVVLQKGTSLVQAIASTGGKKILTGNIEFIRFQNDGKTKKHVFKYDPNANINTLKNPILMEGDVINVRRTLIGKTTEVLGEISNPILSGYGLYSIFSNE